MKHNNNEKKHSFIKKVARFFVTTVIGGLIVILPISIFLVLFRLTINLLVDIIAPVSNLLHFAEAYPKWMADVLALSLILSFFFFIGLLVRLNWGNALVQWIERTYLEKIPFYGTIRETVQQFTGKSKSPFSQVVMVDVFGNDTRMLGFITDEFGDDMYAIFVPTGPNPTNGFVFQVKRHQLEFVDVRSEDAIRSIIAVGAGTRTMMDHARR